MDKYVTIEWPYERIVLSFNPKLKPVTPPLPAESWAALEKAERSIYRTDPGAHGYTDVCTNDGGDDLLILIWGQCYTYLENEVRDWDVMSKPLQQSYVARRVALTFALMAFGPEFLLK